MRFISHRTALRLFIAALCVAWILALGLSLYAVALFDYVTVLTSPPRETPGALTTPMYRPVQPPVPPPIGRSAGEVFIATRAPVPLRQMAADAAKLCGVERALFFSLIQRESAWTDATSPTGARGAAQILKSTLRHVSPSLDFDDEFDRLLGSACYLRTQLDAFGLPGALWAYVQGPGSISRNGPTPHSRQYADDILRGM